MTDAAASNNIEDYNKRPNEILSFSKMHSPPLLRSAVALK